MNLTPITPKTARCQSFTISSPTLNKSTLHGLQQNILENGITKNSLNDQMKLEMAGKIGSALLAENSCLKEKKSLGCKPTDLKKKPKMINSKRMKPNGFKKCLH